MRDKTRQRSEGIFQDEGVNLDSEDIISTRWGHRSNKTHLSGISAGKID
jgi:hypothetical protein